MMRKINMNTPKNPPFLQTAVSGSVCDCETHTFYEWEKLDNKCTQCDKPIIKAN
jgi:hypothetical protein